jgi:hypothetical protein
MMCGLTMMFVALASAGLVNAQGYVPTDDPGTWREPGELLVYWFFTADATLEEKSFIRSYLSEVKALIENRFEKVSVRKVVFKDGRELSQHQIQLLLRYQANHGVTGIATLNFAHSSYGTFTAPSRHFLGATDDRKISVVFLANIFAGTRSAAQRIFRLGHLAGHELGHGLGCPGNASLPVYFFNAFGVETSNLMDEGQPIPSRAKFFDPREVAVQNFGRILNAH